MARIAKPIEYIITDDLSGAAGASERRFEVGGVAYTIDLAETNAQTLNTLLAYLEPFIDAASRVQGNTSKVADRPQTFRDRNALIWADHQGAGVDSWPSSLAIKYDLSLPRIYQILEAARNGKFGSTQLLR